MTPKTMEEVVRKGEVILFGSCARGDYALDSDIDVMVLLDVPQEAISVEIRKKMVASATVYVEVNGYVMT